MAFRVEFARRADNDVAAAEARIGQSASVGRWRARLLRVVPQLETDPHFYPAADAEPAGTQPAGQPLVVGAGVTSGNGETM
jgi:hypothetical protein